MKIYITRHGETQWNMERRMQGRKDSPLTEKGREDAYKLKKRLEAVKFDKIYASPLGRAIETAEIIKENRQMTIEKVPTLMEMSFGEWEGKTVEEIEKVYGTRYQNFWHSPDKYEPLGGESFTEVFQRVGKGLEYIIENSGKEDVSLVVVHAVVIKSIYALVKNLPVKRVWDPPFAHGTSLSILEIKDEERGFLLEADTGHLEYEEK